MLWTQEKLKIAQDILGRYSSFDYAHEQLQNAIGKVSKSSVRNAFYAAGIRSPTSFLRKELNGVHITPAFVEKFNGPLPIRRALPKTSRIIVVPDMHIPYHDVGVWECILSVISGTVNPKIVIIGDFADCMAVSSHPKSLDRRLDFAGEIAAVKEELRRLRHASGIGAPIWYCEGNHEDRITRYLQSTAPELGGFAGMRAPGLLGVKDYGIEWVPYRREVKIGNCSFTHDVGRCGVNCARQSLIDFGGNLVIGHSHRGGVAYQGEVKGSSHFCLNVGWGGNVDDIDYVHRARAKRDWQLGFGIVDQDENGFSWAQFVPVINGRCVVDRKVYGESVAA